MVDDRRVTFARKWLERAQSDYDEFDRFFAAWIALVAAAQRVRDGMGQRIEDDTDRLRVIDYFRVNQAAVVRALRRCDMEMKALAARRGEMYGNTIVDTGNRDLRELFGRLSRSYVNNAPMNEQEKVVALAELLNKVRNNVFHGVKVYDDRADLELLRFINPILVAVLSEAVGGSV
jgi:RecB family exonuclease